MTAVWEIQDEPEERAKARGMALAESGAGRDYQIARECAVEAFERLGRPICADDVRAIMLERDRDQVFGNYMGAVFKGWRSVGFCKSRVKGSHSNLLRTWVPA
jgi:hypothetical protein